MHPAGKGCAGDAPRSHAALDGGWRGSTATLALVAGAARQVGRSALLGACALASALSSGCRQRGNWRSTHFPHGHSSVVSLELFWMTGNLTCIAATRDQRCHPENRGLTPPFIVRQAHDTRPRRISRMLVERHSDHCRHGALLRHGRGCKSIRCTLLRVPHDCMSRDSTIGSKWSISVRRGSMTRRHVARKLRFGRRSRTLRPTCALCQLRVKQSLLFLDFSSAISRASRASRFHDGCDIPRKAYSNEMGHA